MSSVTSSSSSNQRQTYAVKFVDHKKQKALLEELKQDNFTVEENKETNTYTLNEDNANRLLHAVNMITRYGGKYDYDTHLIQFPTTRTVSSQSFKQYGRKSPLIFRVAQPASSYRTVQVIDRQKKRAVLDELKQNNLTVTKDEKHGTFLLAPIEGDVNNAELLKAVFIMNKHGCLYEQVTRTLTFATKQARRINYSTARTIATIAMETGDNNTLLYAANVFHRGRTPTGETVEETEVYIPATHTAGALYNLFYKPVVLQLDSEYKQNQLMPLVHQAMSQVGCKNEDNTKYKFPNFNTYEVNSNKVMASFTYGIKDGKLIQTDIMKFPDMATYLSHMKTYRDLMKDYRELINSNKNTPSPTPKNSVSVEDVTDDLSQVGFRSIHPASLTVVKSKENETVDFANKSTQVVVEV